ncbi:hypothetical protein [Guptibacillus hwajinpoensis]|uniref:Uncharacterized protein n=1 Tax=Guptibacillus hwajinpoensis TaxID=208199 RepID=A0A0J6CV70_9BACL|nr:hypothetical protein [Alkalihalobacillus macyae]KMM37030.1 hypothetical protein AB986_14125 [Alkalihalobacillus macyae]
MGGIRWIIMLTASIVCVMSIAFVKNIAIAMNTTFALIHRLIYVMPIRRLKVRGSGDPLHSLTNL